MNHVVGLGGEGGRRDRGLTVVRRLAGHAQHHGGRLLGRLWRQLEVGRHERVLRGYWCLDGGGYSYDGRLRGHTVAKGGRLWEGVGVGQEAGLAHCCYWSSPGRTYRQKKEIHQLDIQLLYQKTMWKLR